MTRPKILTGAFWTRRIDAATDGVRPAVRSGAQFVLAAIGQGALELNAFAVNWQTLLGAFVGGVVVSVLMTLALPPRTPTPTPTPTPEG